MVSWALAGAALASSTAATPPIAVVIKSHGYPPGKCHGVAWSIDRLHAGVNLACCRSSAAVRGGGAYFIRAFTGSLTFSTLSISTLRKPSGVFSTFWM